MEMAFFEVRSVLSMRIALQNPSECKYLSIPLFQNPTSHILYAQFTHIQLVDK
jgi:hypothetical protein